MSKLGFSPSPPSSSDLFRIGAPSSAYITFTSLYELPILFSCTMCACAPATTPCSTVSASSDKRALERKICSLSSFTFCSRSRSRTLYVPASISLSDAAGAGAAVGVATGPATGAASAAGAASAGGAAAGPGALVSGAGAAGGVAAAFADALAPFLPPPLSDKPPDAPGACCASAAMVAENDNITARHQAKGLRIVANPLSRTPTMVASMA
jgi:hypothetical protein